MIFQILEKVKVYNVKIKQTKDGNKMVFALMLNKKANEEYKHHFINCIYSGPKVIYSHDTIRNISGEIIKVENEKGELTLLKINKFKISGNQNPKKSKYEVSDQDAINWIDNLKIK